ncbi:MAG: hypothetical protein R2681_08615 [Pyrinomonadaceae bacterium]
MKNFKLTSFCAAVFCLAVLVTALTAFGQQVQRTPFDVQHYLMDVKLEPSLNKLSATVDVDLIPQEETRVVTFEINGSLKISEISLVGKTLPGAVTPLPAPTPAAKRSTAKTPEAPVNAVTFIQDQVGVSDLGPSVRIDLGENVPANTKLKLRFVYSGVLVTPEGGPLLTKRLAFIGANDGYLMYAARWFPFHNYAADKATSDITINLPNTFQVVGHSDVPA